MTVTRRIEARLHGPGLPDAGTPTQAEFIGERLRVGDAAEVSAAVVAVEAGGFNQDDIVLSWSEASGSFALLVSSPQAKRALLDTAPGVLAGALRRWNRSVSFTRNLWRTVITTGTAAALVLALGLWQHQRVVAWTAAQIPPEKERRLGQGVIAGLRADGALIETGAALDVVRDVGNRLAQGSARTYEWYLKDDPGINAFAIPGGFVVVHAGLVHAVDSADELAGVLAHEIQHVEQRHTLQHLLYQLGWATLLTVLLGDPSTLTTLLLLEAGNLKFSRDLEAQADAGGIEALRRAGIPPEGLAQFFRRLGKEDVTQMPGWFSTHPETAQRAAAVDASLKALPCGECQPLPHDWAAVRESLYRDELIRRPAAR